MNNANKQLNKTGFTLVEVLVATSIASFVMVIAMGTLHALSESATRIQTHCDTVSELRYATSVLSRDLACLYTDQDQNNRKLLYEDAGDMGVSMLTFYTISHNQVRAAQAEADIYEVEYYLSQTEERSMLMRRVWPHPVKEEEPGGVLSVLADGIGVFLVRFYDGQQWLSEWTEEQQQLPKLIEVALATRPETGTSPFTTSFIIRPVTPQTQGMDVEQMEGANGEAMSTDAMNSEG
ncbi:MAG: prepilin-type N-terminal cleavage/methylation domain-containing protein [Phycisphaerae bacterium]|nr:prepilin-type N-terminal cleavage/methylation domain-containing protein [Phycisphaerae bacterium]